MPDLLTVKRSPIVIVRNFIVVQFLVGVFYFTASVFANYAQIWRGLSVADHIPFQIAQAVFVFGSEVILLLYFFLAWYRQTVRITADQLVYDQGLLSREHTVVPLPGIASATFTQSILGKLTHYGTVLVRDANGSILLRLSGMPEPEQFIGQLTGQSRGHESLPAKPDELADQGEHERLERKSTFRWDMAAGKVSKQLEKASLKTVAAFLNTDGGHLVLGVADDKTIVGMDHDYSTLPKASADGFENHFSNVFKAMLGAHVRHLVKLQPFMKSDKECMLVSVAPSSRPVYLNDEGKEEFFVRTGNGTTSLKLSEASAYIESRWRQK